MKCYPKRINITERIFNIIVKTSPDKKESIWKFSAALDITRLIQDNYRRRQRNGT